MFATRQSFAVTAVLLLTSAALAQNECTIKIDPSHRLNAVSPYLTAVCLEDVNHEVYGGLYSQMIFGESFQESPRDGLSGMWREFHRGDLNGSTAIITDHPFVGSQSQRLSATGGSGTFGIENRGLNRQGIAFAKQHLYQGHIWARASLPTKTTVSAASADGSHVYAAATLSITDANWHRYDFEFTPDTTDPAGRFEIGLAKPGAIDLGYVFLEPGDWGKFKNLPVRRDVADALIRQGITAIRYGGSMVNSAEYRWKKMRGDRDRRPPYRGTWYSQSSNGWGIVDFLNFCEAAEFLPVPDFNIDESPQDMVDFIEYANGPSDSHWGAIRAADGHPAPYGLTHLELGNEERIDDRYGAKFAAIARAIWTKDPRMILAVGDFEYTQPIVDPMHFTGASSKITSLAAHQKILELAHEYDAEVWFDVHLWTQSPPASAPLLAFLSYVDAIDRVANGAKHHVVVFELNANNHQQRRALANAQALIRIETDGRVPFAASANCLQVDGQNDNGWDQGLLFLNPGKVWFQPPGYAMQMFAQNYEPSLVECAISDNSADLEMAATASDDRKTVVLQMLNISDTSKSVSIKVIGWDIGGYRVAIQTLAADPQSSNSALRVDQCHPTTQPSQQGKGVEQHEFPPHSLSFVVWQKN